MITRALGRSFGKMTSARPSAVRPVHRRGFAANNKDNIQDDALDKNRLQLPKGSTSATVEKILDRKSDVK